MPYCETIVTPQSLHIVTWHLCEDLPTLQALWGNAPLPQHYPAGRNEKRCKEILATALLLRHYFRREVLWHHAPNGAPLIEGYNISISHTINYIAIALHPTRRVGIDIERIGERVMRVAPRFMSEDELSQLPPDNATLPDDTSCRALASHMIWSIKEAVYKLHPTAVDFRNNIHTSRLTSLPDGTTTAHLPATGHTMEVHYCRYDNCAMAWAIE